MKNQRGFTLPELLALIMILVILACIIAGGYVLIHFIAKW